MIRKIDNYFNNLTSKTVQPDMMTEAEYAAAFAAIEQDLLQGKAAQATPYLEYVTGLPGAGKSTAVDTLQRDDRYASYVHINFDALRVYHPRYAALVKADPINAAARIDKATEGLIIWLSEQVAARKLNVIMDDAAMGAEMTEIILGPFKSAGYVIDATIVSIPRVVAQQSVALRFLRDMAAAKRGEAVLPRWVNSQEQKNAPTALIETANTICNKHLARSVTLQSRAGAKSVFMLTGPHANRNAHRLIQTLDGELERKLGASEKAFFQKNAKEITALSTITGVAKNTKKQSPKRAQ